MLWGGGASDKPSSHLFLTSSIPAAGFLLFPQIVSAFVVFFFGRCRMYLGEWLLPPFAFSFACLWAIHVFVLVIYNVTERGGSGRGQLEKESVVDFGERDEGNYANFACNTVRKISVGGGDNDEVEGGDFFDSWL